MTRTECNVACVNANLSEENNYSTSIYNISYLLLMNEIDILQVHEMLWIHPVRYNVSLLRRA